MLPQQTPTGKQATTTTADGRTKNIRKMTLCRGRAVHKQYNAFHPDVRLQGKWLSDCGFRSGQVINISCEDRKLTITVAEVQKFIVAES